jgi:tetratricopeptide (TPR) repeat protein
VTPSLLPALLLVPLLLPAAARAPRSQDAAEEQYRFLAALVEKGLHAEAVTEARTFLRAHPRHARAPLARYRLAGALWELGERDDAAREYDALARDASFEYRAEALFRCGEAALARGDAERAGAAFEGVLAAGQDYLVPPALFALGETHFRAGRFDAAEERYAELLRAHPDSAEAPQARRALAWTAWERGDARLPRRQGRPVCIFLGGAAANGIAGREPRLRMERQRMDGIPRAQQCTRCALVGLRSAPGVVAPRR